MVAECVTVTLTRRQAEALLRALWSVETHFDWCDTRRYRREKEPLALVRHRLGVALGLERFPPPPLDERSPALLTGESLMRAVGSPSEEVVDGEA